MTRIEGEGCTRRVTEIEGFETLGGCYVHVHVLKGEGVLGGSCTCIEGGGYIKKGMYMYSGSSRKTTLLRLD